jgi:hypothetical protein
VKDVEENKRKRVGRVRIGKRDEDERENIQMRKDKEEIT